MTATTGEPVPLMRGTGTPSRCTFGLVATEGWRNQISNPPHRITGRRGQRSAVLYPTGMIRRDQQIDRRHHEQREQRADRKPARDHQPHVEARHGAGAAGERSAAPRRAPSPRSSSGSDASGCRQPARSPRAWRCRCAADSLANSTIRMPCLLIRPISVTRPTSV